MGKTLRALSFAHLVGFGNKAKAAEEDEDREKNTGERDHEDGNAKKAETPADDREKRDDETEEEYDARMKKLDAEEDDEEAKAESDEKDDDKEDNEKEMRGSSPAAQARRREQQRCAAIFASPAAANNPELAANLAFKTRLPRSEALAVLASSKSIRVRGERLDRSARNPHVGSSAPSGLNSKEAVQKSLDAAFAKVGPRRR